ncbi:MAG TPA: hypothetical protein VGP36_11075 [Mycobacteriales bacterium]|nr:hypothetical protein [Mycobacteriales bacterium]
MKLYADTTGRFSRQVVGDLLVLGWVALWIWLAVQLHDRLLELAAPGVTLEKAGTSFSGSLNDAGDKVGGLPVVGDDVAGALRRAGGAGDSLADAGRNQQDAVHQLAFFVPALILLLAAGIVVALWLPGRVRWSREAGAARRLLSGPDALEVFATRAVVRRHTRELAALPEATITRWRAGDEDAATALAELELRALGLRPR